MTRFEAAHREERYVDVLIQKNLLPDRTINQISCHRKEAKYHGAVAAARGVVNGDGSSCCGLGSS